MSPLREELDTMCLEQLRSCGAIPMGAEFNYAGCIETGGWGRMVVGCLVFFISEGFRIYRWFPCCFLFT